MTSEEEAAAARREVDVMIERCGDLLCLFSSQVEAGAVVGLALASVSGDDTAAGVVDVACRLAGLWQLERGLRSEFQRRLRGHDDER